MNETELMLRAALAWARFRDESGYLADKIPLALDFIPNGPVKVLDHTTQRPHLRWVGDGRLVTVSTTPGGRVLRVVDAYLDHHSGTTEMRLPREFWVVAS